MQRAFCGEERTVVDETRSGPVPGADHPNVRLCFGKQCCGNIAGRTTSVLLLKGSDLHLIVALHGGHLKLDGGLVLGAEEDGGDLVCDGVLQAVCLG